MHGTRRSSTSNRSRYCSSTLLMIKRVVVPVDFSKYSLKALDYAVELARQFRAELHAVFVVETVYFGAPGAGTAVDAFIAAQKASAAAALLRLERRYARRRVRLRTAVLSGAPAVAIRDACIRLGADLIVIATHGRTGISHLLLGSVAEHMVRIAPCPVLTLRPDRPRGRRQAPGKGR
jgi:nucleotide-binding universal stress UspA family protein